MVEDVVDAVEHDAIEFGASSRAQPSSCRAATCCFRSEVSRRPMTCAADEAIRIASESARMLIVEHLVVEPGATPGIGNSAATQIRICPSRW